MKKYYFIIILFIGLLPNVTFALAQLPPCNANQHALWWFIVEIIGAVAFIVALVDGARSIMKKVQLGRKPIKPADSPQRPQIPWVTIVSFAIFAMSLVSIITVKNSQTLCSDVQDEPLTNVQLPAQFTK